MYKKEVTLSEIIGVVVYDMNAGCDYYIESGIIKYMNSDWFNLNEYIKSLSVGEVR